MQWSGEIEAPTSDDYTFTLASNDSALVELQDQVIINQASRHNFRTASSAPIPLVAGKRYRARVMVSNFNSTSTGAILWWSGTQFTPQLIPLDRLYPGTSGSTTPFRCIAPISSKVNPAWVPFVGGSYGIIVAVNDSPIQVTQENPNKGYLANQDNPIGLTLAKDAPAVLTVNNNGVLENKSIEWQITDLSLETGYVPLILRVGDKLLITDTTLGDNWSFDKNYTGTFTSSYVGKVGDKIELSYDAPGVYRLISRVDDHDRQIQITVVGVNFNGPIACELTYQRNKGVTLVGGSQIGFYSTDDTLMGVQGVVSGTSAQLKLQPYRYGNPVVQARILDAFGPIIGQQSVDAFDIRTSAARRIVIEKTYPDGSQLASAHMLMDPKVSNLDLYMHIFVSGVTFNDSTLDHHVSTSIFSLNSESTWNGVMYPYGMIRAPSVNSGLCHTFVVYQNGVQVSY